MTTKDEVRSTVETLRTKRALKLALSTALEALEETRNALAWFYDSYPQDVTKKGNELLPHVETVLAAVREALASKSEALASEASEQPAPVSEPHKQQSTECVEPVECMCGICKLGARKPLTDEEIEEININLNGGRDLARLFARAIEQAHGIKE